MRNNRLRLISGSGSLQLDPTNAKEMLAKATDVFRYIDSNFERWHCNLLAQPTTITAVQVYELARDSTLQEMFVCFGVKIDRLEGPWGMIFGRIRCTAPSYTDA
jgi:hypothetical protein